MKFANFPAIRRRLDDVTKMLEENYDAVIVELGSDPEYALDLVESIGANGRATVMVYSDNTDSEMLVRCMQAGAREFLALSVFEGSGGGGAGAGHGAAAGRGGHEPGGRKTADGDGRQGRRGRDHAGLQSGRGAGPGKEAEDAADRSGSAAGRCGTESGHRGGVFDDRCAGSVGPAGCTISFPASGKAQHRAFAAGGAGKVCSVPGQQPVNRAADPGGAAGV